MLKCEICGKEFKSCLSRHIVIHNITVDEYKEKYPNSKLVSEDYSRRRSQISKNIFDDEHREAQRKNLARQRQETNFSEIQRNAIKSLWKNQEFRDKKNKLTSKITSERNKENWKNEEYRQKMSNLHKNVAKGQWQSSDYRNRMIPIILKNIETRNNIQVFYINGKEYKFRSLLEKSIIIKLVDLKIPFEYETLKIRYFDSVQNKERTYIPDLFLKDYNLILEIKPKKTYR